MHPRFAGENPAVLRMSACEDGDLFISKLCIHIYIYIKDDIRDSEKKFFFFLKFTELLQAHEAWYE